MLFQETANNDPDLQELQTKFAPLCKTSRLAIQGDPHENKNYRNNPSLLVQFVDETTGKTQNIVIDVGKTFRETALRWMPRHDIRSLDAVLLTHHHMDAVAGLDDLRGFQKNLPPRMVPTPVRVPIEVYLSQECLEQVSKQFPWLFPKKVPVDKDAIKRHVADLDVTIIKDLEPFHVKGLRVVPLPVWHGDDLICMGYAFSLQSEHGKTTNVVYLSDISRMKEETLEYIQTKLPPTDIFIVDTLVEKSIHPVHFNLNQAVALAKQIGAKQTYLMGMNCDSFPPHDEMNALLQRERDIEVSFAHDGLVLDL
jgi:phosphoribosyl 1,2-cyclic phosphodiesterase